MSFLSAYRDKPTWLLLLIFGGIALFSFFFFSFIGVGMAWLIYGINPMLNPADFSNLNSPVTIDALRLIQLFNAIGIFIAPPLLFAYLVGFRPKQFFHLGKPPTIRSALYVCVIMIVALPLINWMAAWNEGLHLPQALQGIEQWMRSAEQRAQELTEALLQMDSTGRFIMNLVVIAIIPAIGEELFFRGGVQGLLHRSTKNDHLAIWVAAFLFSALHMQFLGFFPRLFLGALFGYIYVWSGNLWLPIIGHFANNGFAVIATYFIQRGSISKEVEEVGANPGEIGFSAGSLALFLLLMLLLYRQLTKKGAQAPLFE